MKMLMLAASYDYILHNDEALQRCIGYSYNDYDIHRFRAWNDYVYEFDTSHCEKYLGFYQSVVNIYESKSHTLIWRIGVGLETGTF